MRYKQIHATYMPAGKALEGFCSYAQTHAGQKIAFYLSGATHTQRSLFFHEAEKHLAETLLLARQDRCILYLNNDTTCHFLCEDDKERVRGYRFDALTYPVFAAFDSFYTQVLLPCCTTADTMFLIVSIDIQEKTPGILFFDA